MSNLYKRILTSIFAFPLSIFFIIMGGNYMVSFLCVVLILGNFEIFSVFKRKLSIIFLDTILVLSLLSILYLRNDTASSFILLIWVIILTISSDIGGYIFGKTFKWKKLTKISPKKTISGVFGSYFLSIICLFIIFESLAPYSQPNFKFFVITVIFSTVAQIGDLTISYFKRLDKIKDTGKILPGHGGIFDRIDALMFVAIFALVMHLFGI
mgnify:CR=1 FL=1